MFFKHNQYISGKYNDTDSQSYGHGITYDKSKATLTTILITLGVLLVCLGVIVAAFVLFKRSKNIKQQKQTFEQVGDENEEESEPGLIESVENIAETNSA